MFVQQSEVSGLCVSNFTTVFNGGIEGTVFHPGFGRALLAQPHQKTVSTPLEIVRITGGQFSYCWEKSSEGLMKAPPAKVVDGIGVPQQHTGLKLSVDIHAPSTDPSPAGEKPVTGRPHKFGAELQA